MAKKKKPGPPKTTGKAPARSIRIWGKDWDRWKRIAAKRQISLTELIRRRMNQIKE